MKMTRSQIVDGMKMAGAFLVALVLPIAYGVHLYSKFGTVLNAPHKQGSAFMFCVGAGLVGGGMIYRAMTGRPAVRRFGRSIPRYER